MLSSLVPLAGTTQRNSTNWGDKQCIHEYSAYISEISLDFGLVPLNDITLEIVPSGGGGTNIVFKSIQSHFINIFRLSGLVPLNGIT